jgi:hypothetical protein
MDDHQEGKGTLTSKYFPDTVFEVEYSITFWLGIQQIASAPRIMAKQADVVHYVRSIDGREIPNGEFELSRSADGTTEFTRMRKTPQGWITLTNDHA